MSFASTAFDAKRRAGLALALVVLLVSPAIGQQVLLSADFDSGLPSSDWTMTGDWHVTGNCLPSGSCAAGQWAYFGVGDTCSADGATGGVLTAPAVSLPGAGPITLTYCSTYQADTSGDPPAPANAAWVEVNGIWVDTANNPSISELIAETRVVDLTEFAGETITISFHFNPGPGWYPPLGWMVDGISLTGVASNQPPVITCNDPVVLWSPKHELVDAASAFSVDDPDNDPVDVSVRVFSDETEIPDTGDGTGRHAPDYKTQLASGAQGHFLRSERRGAENGRFYIGVITADDGRGGVTSQVCVLAVCPHDQNDPASLDDVLAQATAAAAAVQTTVDNNDTLPPDGLYEHGLSDPLGPKQ